jgi:dihydrolipoamide dehydrogenase
MLPLSLSYDHRVIDGADADAVPALGRRGDRAALPSFTHRLMAETIQLVVLGAGPGGYAAAFYAADLGMQVALVDEEKNPGGVCLYRGCIPSKALLHVAKVIDEAKHAGNWGVTFTNRRSTSTSSRLQAGRRRQAHRRRRQHRQDAEGHVRTGSRDVDRTDVDVGRRPGRHDRAAVRASDSRDRLASHEDSDALTRQPANDGLDVGSRESRTCPKSLLVIGGGYIGLELGTVYATLGSKVSVVEMTPGLLPWRRSRPRRRAGEAAEEPLRVHHAEHEGREGRARQ